MEEDGLDFALSQALDIAEAGESLNEMSLTQTVEVYKVRRLNLQILRCLKGWMICLIPMKKTKIGLGHWLKRKRYILLKSRLKARTRVKTL